MKRSLDDAECHASKELFLPTQKYAAAAVMRVFGSHDLVLRVLAPQLDLETLFHFSLVNRRLRELLSQTETLQKAKHYKGTEADLPGTLLAYPDVRITRYMTSPLGFFSKEMPTLSRWELSMVERGEDSVTQHMLERFVLPLLECKLLSDESVTAHLTPYLLRPLGFSTFNREIERLLYKTMTRAFARVRHPLIPYRIFQAHTNMLQVPEQHRAAMAHRNLLIAQSAGNPEARDALIAEYGPFQNNNDAMLLFCAAMSNPSFLAAERERLKHCVGAGILLAIACVFGVEPVMDYLIKTDGDSAVKQATVCLGDSSEDGPVVELYLLLDRFNEMETASTREAIQNSVRERIGFARERLQLMVEAKGNK